MRGHDAVGNPKKAPVVGNRNGSCRAINESGWILRSLALVPDTCRGGAFPAPEEIRSAVRGSSDLLMFYSGTGALGRKKSCLGLGR